MLSDVLFYLMQDQLLSRVFVEDMVEMEQIAEGKNIEYDRVSPPDVSEEWRLFGPERPNYPLRKPGAVGVLTTADSVIVEDAETGMRLLGRRSASVRSIGSVTKLMAAMVFLDENPDLSKRVTIREEDYVGGGRVYLRFEDGVVLGDVLGASMVGSDNTATKSLATHLGITHEEFVKKMNEKAERLGMERTVFTDATGILPSNVSTASEIVDLLREAEKYPELQRFMQAERLSITQSSGYAVSIENTNKLLMDEDLAESGTRVVGGKTGYLPEAGYVLSSALERDGRRIYVVVMGSSSLERRVIDTIQVADWAFKSFEWPEL